MNSYITLDNKQYSTTQKVWRPRTIKPSGVRLTLLGNLDSTYGAGPLFEFTGEIRAEVTPKTGYGSPSDLKASLEKKQGLSFTDHLGASYTVHVRDFEESSLSPLWDGGGNVMFYSTTLVGKRT
jgi:hypothetical protein